MTAARSKSASAASTNFALSKSVSTLKGVGSAVQRSLGKLGIETVGDLLLYVPRRYDDYSKIVEIAVAKPGQLTIKGKIERVNSRYARRGLHITEAIITDGRDKLKAIWFNQPYRAASLPRGIEIYMAGKLERVGQGFALNHPSVERVSTFTRNTARIVPVYPQSAEVGSNLLRRLVGEALPSVKNLQEQLPAKLIKSNSLMAFGVALREVHFPSLPDKAEQATRRLAFDELFALILTHKLAKQDLEQYKAPAIKFDERLAKDFVGRLPFKLTDAQRRAAWEILQDIAKPRPMNRLLQGDVGSGKTVVAAFVALMAARQGYQVALMAPTEILARQHYATVSDLLRPFDVSCELLVGGQKPTERKKIEANIATGRISIVLGTHALIQKGIRFARLGLVIVDEQHRFGVRQRQELVGKAKTVPHLLSMTATPIPRSLALTLYGELDISTIDELPLGRKPVTTKLVPLNARDEMYRHVETEIVQGRQVYVVCPIIEDSDVLGVKSVTSEHDRLQKSVFARRRIGLLHGRLKSEEKEAVLGRFKTGDVDILVSTTVVEVGVDVPNATVLIIEGAERFGLAQLHQLRGRVGRGEHQSHCYLITTDERQARERLSYLQRTHSGFELAEADLKLRGAGEIYGTRQHGELSLRIASLTDSRLIAAAQKAVNDFLSSREDTSAYPLIDRRVKYFQAQTYLN